MRRLLEKEVDADVLASIADEEEVFLGIDEHSLNCRQVVHIITEVKKQKSARNLWGCLGVAIRWGCQVIRLAKSSFYYKSKEKGEKAREEADLRDKIEAMCLQFPRYGYRRVTQALRWMGLRVNHKKVLSLMRENDLLCRAKRKWKKTIDSRHHFARYPNLIKELVINRINQEWLSESPISVSEGALFTWQPFWMRYRGKSLVMLSPPPAMRF